MPYDFEPLTCVLLVIGGYLLALLASVRVGAAVDDWLDRRRWR